LDYVVYYDTLDNFSTASSKSIGPKTATELSGLKRGKAWFWKVFVKNFYGDSLWSDTNAFFISHTATSVDENTVIPNNFLTLENYPNPFNPATTISFDLPKDGNVNLKIYDVTGRLVRVLVQEHKLAGAHTILWDGLDDAGQKVASGVYIYRMEFVDAAGEKMVMTRKMSLIK